MAYDSTIGTVLITEKEIITRAEELGKQITKDYKGKELVLVGILRGAVMWMAELMKNINLEDLTIDFMAVSSYGAATKSSGQVKINKDLNSDIMGKDVIIVEDIVDTGTTLHYLRNFLQSREANSVEICSMLDKPERREADVPIKYKGFEVDNLFIVGYGLDYDQKYRNLPYISFLNE
ncbi:MAG: hypoxanthine phosphoribosyltransferase [Firmicutes bacterium]|nr:hypoxanthine phosphoribosyltransferase [Bacillota bacterium]